MPCEKFWLVVEDDDNDFTLFRLACIRAFGYEPPVHREIDGIAAMEFLAVNLEKPEIIVSDLKMPLMTGLELLDWVRHSDYLSQIPFVMLSNSDLQRDVQQAQKLGATSYLVKPTALEEYVGMVMDLPTVAESGG